MADMTPRPEALAAAGWWAQHLGRAVHDTGMHEPGEAALTVHANVVSHVSGDRFTDADRESFRHHLAEVVEEKLSTNGAGWLLERPDWGSYLRSLFSDYSPPPECAEAALRAGLRIDSLDLPIKTCMWVNPGRVSVRCGFGAETVVIYPEPAPE